MYAPLHGVLGCPCCPPPMLPTAHATHHTRCLPPTLPIAWAHAAYHLVSYCLHLRIAHFPPTPSVARTAHTLPLTASASGPRSCMPPSTHTVHMHAAAYASASRLPTAHTPLTTTSASGLCLPTPLVTRIVDAHTADCASASRPSASCVFCHPHHAHACRRSCVLVFTNVTIPVRLNLCDSYKAIQKIIFTQKSNLCREIGNRQSGSAMTNLNKTVHFMTCTFPMFAKDSKRLNKYTKFVFLTHVSSISDLIYYL